MPKRDFGEVAREFQRAEDDKQVWVQPDQQKELTGDFIARLRKQAAAGQAKAQAIAAKAGVANGQHALGLCHHRGAGVPKDLAIAAKQYRLAAEQKQIDSACNLAVLLDQGLGVTRDFAEAARWYRVAAEAGHNLARYRLGLFLRDGTGVDSNLDEAPKWKRHPTPCCSI